VIVNFEELADLIAERVARRTAGSDEVLTVEQAAQYLQLSPTTIRGLLRKQELPGFKYGDQWRIHKTAVIHQLTHSSLPQAAD